MASIMKVGAVVPLSHEPPVRFSAIREYARLIEQRGLDSVWVFDHLLFRRPQQADCRRLGSLDHAVGAGRGHAAGGTWGCWSRRLRFVIQLCSPR